MRSPSTKAWEMTFWWSSTSTVTSSSTLAWRDLCVTATGASAQTASFEPARSHQGLRKKSPFNCGTLMAARLR